MNYIRVKYRTKVMDDYNKDFKDFVATVNAMAIEAEAQSTRFIWTTADGLGMALEYENMVSLCINQHEVTPITEATVSEALLYGCPHPDVPVPPVPPSNVFRVLICPDRVLPPGYSWYFAPDSSSECLSGSSCTFLIKMESTSSRTPKLSGVYANGVKLSPNTGSSYPLYSFTITDITEDKHIAVEYYTEQIV